MSDALLHLQQISQNGGYFSILCAAVTEGNGSYFLDLQIPVSSLSLNPSQFNNAVEDAAKALLLADYGVTIGAGDKVIILDGAV